MTLTQRYATRHYPDTVRIFGVELQPYCIGHALLLHKIGSPFVGQSSSLSIGLGDLLLALWICSRPPEEAAAGVAGCRVRFRLRWWAVQIVARRRGPDAIEAGIDALLDYIADAWDGPDVWEKDEDAASPKPGAPALTRLMVVLCGELGRTRADALNTPIGVALWDCAGLGDLRGALEWASEDDIAAIEHIRKRESQERNTQPATRNA